MRWTSVFIYFSAIALVGAVISQLTGWQSVRVWFLLAWAALLLPVAMALFSHPMRGPAWGMFVGFFGLVGTVWLIVIQLFAVVVTLVWSGAITAVLLKAVGAVTALRATQDEEREGLDISIHGEAIQ